MSLATQIYTVYIVNEVLVTKYLKNITVKYCIVMHMQEKLPSDWPVVVEMVVKRKMIFF